MERLRKFLSTIFISNPKDGRFGSIDYNIWLAQITGVPLLGFKYEPFGIKAILIFYGFFMTFIIAILYTVCELYDLALCLNDFDALTQNSCLTLSHVAGVLKAANIHYRSQKVKAVVEKLKFLTKTYVRTNDQCESFYRGELENKVFLTIYAVLVGVTGFSATILLFFSTKFIGQSFPYRIKFPVWLPFSMQLIFIGISLPMTALQIVAIDYLNVNLINQIRFQLNFLNLAFNDLTLDIKKRPELKNFNSTKVKQQLDTIVKHHCFLFELRNEIEDIFRMPILMQFAASLIIFGLTGFRATVKADANITDMVLYLYCGCLLCQLFIYCWFGNDVFEESKTLAINGYHCSWYEFDVKFQKSFLNFLTASQHPLIFTAGGVFSLSLPSFTGILGKSYSFIALLRQLYGNR